MISINECCESAEAGRTRPQLSRGAGTAWRSCEGKLSMDRIPPAKEADMRNTIGITLAMLALTCADAAELTKQDYNAARKRIAAEYQAEREKCGSRYGNAADMCIARAHGARDVAKAELQAEYKPSPRTNYDAAIARSKAAYANAKEECDEQRGVAKKACMKDAKSALESSRAEARAAMAQSRAEEAAKSPPGR